MKSIDNIPRPIYLDKTTIMKNSLSLLGIPPQTP